MDAMALSAALARVTRFVAAVSTGVPRVDEALPALRRLLEDAGVHFKLAGGVAVIHHGYVRATDDLDVLVEADALGRIRPLLGSYGFSAESDSRLRHLATGVGVDLLVAGRPLPRAGAGSYPSPVEVGASPGDSAIVDLPSLVTLKLRAARHQDLADVVALLKPLEDVAYTVLESQVPAELRPRLAELRRDALEELSWSR
ncbi:MAG: hypothetical protein HYY06_06875 [Deltaproteobacteria bacterium]|nr:hypothetical protein [Deltaproteobacteria bacterium]